MAIEVEQNEDAYFPRVKHYLMVLLDDLNNALKESRVSKNSRRGICETFLYAHCGKLDQQWFRCEGQTRYPLIAFSKQFIDFAKPPTDDNTILIGDKGNELHAIVSGLLDEFFDELNEVVPENTIGQLGEELPDEECQLIPEAPRKVPCLVCKGTGSCFCLRKGSGISDRCPRCNGKGKCQHCHGTGLSN